MASCSDDKPAHSSSNFVIILPSIFISASTCISRDICFMFQFFFFFFFFLNFWPCHMACGILVPQPGNEPQALGGESRVLTTGLPGKFLCPNSYIDFIPAIIYLNSKSIVCPFHGPFYWTASGSCFMDTVFFSYPSQNLTSNCTYLICFFWEHQPPVLLPFFSLSLSLLH